MTLAFENLDENIVPPKSQFFESTLNEIKLQNNNKIKSIEPFRVEGNLWLLELKRYNRNTQIRNKKVKDSTCDYKLKVDKNYLILQNLLYQVKYLKQEIKKCYDYQSQYEDIYWIPLQQFLKIKPEFADEANDLKNLEDMVINEGENKTKLSEDLKIESEHRLMIARMEWELEQRKSLNVKYMEMLKKKIAMEHDIRDKRKLLTSIYPALTDALKASQPLQKLFNLDFEKDYKYANFIYNLPTPLYLIYTKWQAYTNLYGVKDIEIEIIEGDDSQISDSTSNLLSILEQINHNDKVINMHDKFETEDILMTEDSSLNYEHELDSEYEARMALSINDQRYGDLNQMRGTILDCDLRHCLTLSKYSIKITTPMTSETFSDLKIDLAAHILANGYGFKTVLYLYFYPKLNVITVKASVVESSGQSSPSTQDNDYDDGLVRSLWESLKLKLLLNLDLKNGQPGGMAEGDLISSSYYLPKLIEAIVGIEQGACSDPVDHLSTTWDKDHVTVDRCLAAIFAEIGHPFLWLQNLAGLVNASKTRSTMGEYYSLSVIKRVVDSLSRRLASRLHLKHLVSQMGYFSIVGKEGLGQNKRRSSIRKMSWSEASRDFKCFPALEGGTRSGGQGDEYLGVLNLVVSHPIDGLSGGSATRLEVHLAIAVPVDCDACYHGNASDQSQAPLVSFKSHAIVHVTTPSTADGGGATGSRDKLADLRTTARLYKAFKDLGRRVNQLIRGAGDGPCALAQRIGQALKGVREISEGLETDQTPPHHVTKGPRVDKEMCSPLGEQKDVVWVDMKAIFD